MLIEESDTTHQIKVHNTDGYQINAVAMNVERSITRSIKNINLF
jgi:hypothetical protein